MSSHFFEVLAVSWVVLWKSSAVYSLTMNKEDYIPNESSRGFPLSRNNYSLIQIKLTLRKKSDGKRPKQSFLWRRNTNSKQTHEKMLNIAHYWRNANQNCNEYHLTPTRMAIIKKSANKCWRRYGEKGIFLHSWWQCKLTQLLHRMIWRFL